MEKVSGEGGSRVQFWAICKVKKLEEGGEVCPAETQKDRTTLDSEFSFPTYLKEKQSCNSTLQAINKQPLIGKADLLATALILKGPDYLWRL